MPRLRNKEYAAPSDDYGWRWGEPVEEVRKTIAQQLQEYHSEKAAKQRRKEELEEIIRLGDRVDYGDSGDDDDKELTITRRESMRYQVEMEERQRRRVRISQDSVFEIGGELPFLQPVLQVAAKVRKLVRGPSAYEVTRVYLEDEYIQE
ncbi:hypothetical protein GOBAR_DD19348 [Gossypium barbadense]|nr:hypothetical protein GOBAR_DD19348 [Gossypium barbadense]